MEIRKALITAAGEHQRTLPLQSLVDRDGTHKTALAILVGEVLSAGIESVGVVVAPGDEATYRPAADPYGDKLEFIVQPEPRGYAHAIHCAASFTGADPFLLMVGDHLYLSNRGESCARQLVDVAVAEDCAVSAVQATHESQLPHYGAMGGRLKDAGRKIYEVETVLEKPTPTEAEQHLIVPGLRAGYYLCFFGMHILPPSVQDILSTLLDEAGDDTRAVHLRAALARLLKQERYLACELDGRRTDIGLKYGLLTAQLALGLSGDDRLEVLSILVDSMAAKLRQG